MISLNFQLTADALLIFVTIDDVTITLTIPYDDLPHYVLSFDDLIHLAMEIHNIHNDVPVPMDDFFNENPLGGPNNPIVIMDTDEEDVHDLMTPTIPIVLASNPTVGERTSFELPENRTRQQKPPTLPNSTDKQPSSVITLLWKQQT